MRKIKVVLLSLIVSGLFGIAGMILIVTQVFGYDSVCNVASKMLSETEVHARAIFDREIANRRMEGSGSVRNVRTGRNDSEFVIDVDCGNDVIVQVRSSSAGLRDLKVGNSVSFAGTTISWRRQFYRDSSRTHMLIIMDDVVVR